MCRCMIPHQYIAPLPVYESRDSVTQLDAIVLHCMDYLAISLRNLGHVRSSSVPDQTACVARHSAACREESCFVKNYCVISDFRDYSIKFLEVRVLHIKKFYHFLTLMQSFKNKR